MKRVRFLIVGALLLSALFTFVFAGSAAAASGHATACSWRVAQTATISFMSGEGGPGLALGGTVYLYRDGCGDIKASIKTGGVGELVLTLQTSDKAIYNYYEYDAQEIDSPVFSGYGNVSVQAVGVTVVLGPSVSVGFTPYDNGN